MAIENNPKEEVETKMVGGQVPIDLYWQFKQAQGKNKDTAQTALESAINMYIEASKGGDQ